MRRSIGLLRVVAFSPPAPHLKTRDEDEESDLPPNAVGWCQVSRRLAGLLRLPCRTLGSLAHDQPQARTRLSAYRSPEHTQANRRRHTRLRHSLRADRNEDAI